MTISISNAPSATAYLISSSRWGRGVWPAGNPAATEATGMPVPVMFQKPRKLNEKSKIVANFTFQKFHSFGNTRRINTDGACGDVFIADTQLLDQVLPNRALCFETQALHVALGVISRQGREVGDGHGSQQPCGLPVRLDRPPILVCFSAPNKSREIDMDRLDPSQVERHAGIARVMVSVLFSHLESIINKMPVHR